MNSTVWFETQRKQPRDLKGAEANPRGRTNHKTSLMTPSSLASFGDERQETPKANMCGRYSMALGNEELYDALEARLPRMFEQGRPRWERPQDHHPR